MLTSPATKACLVAIAAVAWLTDGPVGPARLLAVTAAAALVTLCWIRLGSARPTPAVSPGAAAPAPPACRRRGVAHPPRGARRGDVRCPASGTTPRQRRT